MINVYLMYIAVVLTVSAWCSQPGLQQLHIVARHGFRTPTETYPCDPYKEYNWPNGWGALTNLGKLQLYQLGQYYRRKYGQFIGEQYKATDLEVWSSYSARCIMSAQLFLAGLYPPKGAQIWNPDLLWQPIPVLYKDRSNDDLIAMKKSCPKYDQALKVAFRSGQAKKLDSENAELYSYLSKHTCTEIVSISDVEFMYNTLEIEQQFNLTLPQWTDHVSLRHLKRLASVALSTYTQNDYMKRMKGGVFLNRTFDLMANIERSPKVLLYAAHDITIVNIMRALNVVDTIKPNYAASLVFELYDNQEIRIYYRDGVDAQNTEMFINSSQKRYKLHELQANLKDVLPSSSWENECKMDVP